MKKVRALTATRGLFAATLLALLSLAVSCGGNTPATTPAARPAITQPAGATAVPAATVVRSPSTTPAPARRNIAPQPSPTRNSASANCANTSVGLVPLTDLGTGTYKGFQGGLYPNGSNQPPEAYRQAGLQRARAIQPLNTTGQPDPNGKIVLLSIGMSNATQEFAAFKRVAEADPQKNPQLVIVDGAQGGQDAELIKNPKADYWTFVAQRLHQANASEAQVQVVWIKEAIAGEREAFPADARHLQNDLRAIVDILRQRFPNLQIAYLSSRTYAGYAVTPLNPEPYAYQSGFAVKWLIEDNIANGAPGPWLAWGPYLWTDGTKGRSDGFVWNCADTAQDGTHPSPSSGVQKVGMLLLNFLKTEETARSWFAK